MSMKLAAKLFVLKGLIFLTYFRSINTKIKILLLEEEVIHFWAFLNPMDPLVFNVSIVVVCFSKDFWKRRMAFISNRIVNQNVFP